MKVFHFMRYKWWFLGSLSAVTVFAVLAIFVVGLDLGIDFKGGVRMEFSLEKQASVDDVRELVSKAGFFEPVVQSFQTPDTTDNDAFMVTAQQAAGSNAAEVQTNTDAQIQRVKTALAAGFGLNAKSWAEEQVGASFGANTAKMALIGVAIAVLLIVVYLSWRFEFKFAIPAILALVHDVGLTLGIYAATQRLVTSATVAAILTILGYSVHDTIIVYDRMRENTLLMKKETYGDMVDLSIRQTMVRSINTTVALLLPLVAILIFGGPTLKDFAMALTIGVVAGTYSSFFVASPLVTIWKEREPMYRKRVALAKGEGLVGAGGDTGVARSASTPVTVTGVTPTAKPLKAGSGKPGQSAGASKTAKGKSSKGKPAGKNAKRPSR